VNGFTNRPDLLTDARGPVEGAPESIFFHPPVAVLDTI
jgi:hypothetical protein